MREPKFIITHVFHEEEECVKNAFAAVAPGKLAASWHFIINSIRGERDERQSQYPHTQRVRV